MHGCHRTTPLRHPWIVTVANAACGYDERLTHPKCTGCYRQREESPLDQLRAIDARHSEDGLKREVDMPEVHSLGADGLPEGASVFPDSDARELYGFLPRAWIRR